MKKNWMDRQVLIIGAARQGLALARYLSKQGASIILNDNRPENLVTIPEDLAKNKSIKFVFGEHPVELLSEVELVCVSGGVPLDIPLIEEAQKRNISLSNDSQIFMQSVTCPVIGITGSAGKTTTTALVSQIAKLAVKAPRTAWVGGNIGTPLIDQVEHISANDIVILELSSFQLELMTISPTIAAITNITPNHLDRHGTLKAYTAAKANILTHQNSKDIAILNREDDGAWQLKDIVQGKLVSFGLVPQTDLEWGSYLEIDRLYMKNNKGIHYICDTEDIHLRGSHNVLNVLAAIAISDAAGFPLNAIQSGIKSFSGVPHRLEVVREVHGVRWINDSIATAPERTIAAISSFDEPIVLLLGGKDKNLPWEKLADLVHKRVDHVVLFGDAAEKIEKVLTARQNDLRPLSLYRCGNMVSALQKANEIAAAGDIVLLSPGGTSYDEFKDFEERGERFREWVRQLP